MPLKKNIVANYVGTGTVVLGPILALPWYLTELGPQQFGLIGFIVLFQTVLGLLDAGLSQALVREFAVRFDSTDEHRLNSAVLLFGFERIYWLFAVLAGFFGAVLADPIATYWLNLNGLPDSIGKEAVLGASLIFAVQFPGSVYRSMLIGAQAQIELNVILTSSALLRHLGGIGVVVIWPTLTAYLIWHAAVALLETLARATAAWRIQKVDRRCVAWDSDALRPVWKLFASMSGATLLGALTVQMDRIVLSRMVDIEQLGYYSIAATIAVGSLQLVNPLTQAMLPKIIDARNNPNELAILNKKMFWMMAAVVVTSSVFYLVAGKLILNLWLRDMDLVSKIFPILSVMLIGTALNAFYNIGYINWLAKKMTYRFLQVNFVSLLVSVVLIPVFVFWYGPLGAAIGWLTINSIGLALSLEWLFARPKTI